MEDRLCFLPTRRLPQLKVEGEGKRKRWSNQIRTLKSAHSIHNTTLLHAEISKTRAPLEAGILFKKKQAARI